VHKPDLPACVRDILQPLFLQCFCPVQRDFGARILPVTARPGDMVVAIITPGVSRKGSVSAVVSETERKYASSLRRMVAYGGRSKENATEYRLSNDPPCGYCTEVQGWLRYPARQVITAMCGSQRACRRQVTQSSFIASISSPTMAWPSP